MCVYILDILIQVVTLLSRFWTSLSQLIVLDIVIQLLDIVKNWRPCGHVLLVVGDDERDETDRTRVRDSPYATRNPLSPQPRDSHVLLYNT